MASRPVYVDSSAVVKLVIEETGSWELPGYLERRATLTSELSRVEVIRTIRRHGLGAGAVARARDVLARFDLIALDRRVIDIAESIEDTRIRTLDAVHLATALAIRDDLSAFITYDRQLGQAAESHGFTVAAPGVDAADG